MLSTCASSALITRLLRARLASLCLVPKPREEWRLRARCFASHRFKSTTTGDDEPRETGGQTIADDTNTAWTAHNAWTSSSPRGSLYPGHVRLTSLQKALLAVTSGIGAIAFPERADLVGTANELSGVWALQNMRDRMRKDSVGSELLRRRPRITDTTLERAHECAPGTLGKTWSTFMGTRKFDPNDRPAVRFVDDEELAYVATRAREVHDIWHVLFDVPTTVQGELALKALEFFQTGAPSSALAALVAPARLPPKERAYLFHVLYPWARVAGNRATDLVCLDYESEMATDLGELRVKWRIELAPGRDAGGEPK